MNEKRKVEGRDVNFVQVDGRRKGRPRDGRRKGRPRDGRKDLYIESHLLYILGSLVTFLTTHIFPISFSGFHAQRL
jgi:hypothetical protein